ncbi:hypothetical protein PL373_09275 [Tenacibaculum maritimum]|nr:hypothetical protein [Tenacibaculum maritimum]MDB0601335.1 hypothetical protein [Tenacibaculum maritimum]MDB0611756.1 hypothetical protein [Tenacibaculum maritimum]
MKKKSSLPKKVGEIATKTKKKVSKSVTKENVGKTIKNTGGFIADNKKELLYLTGAIVIGVIGYKIYKATSKGISNVFEDKTETIDVEININKDQTTISKEQAQQFAKTLLDACNHMEPLYGTDEEAINQVFLRLKTGDDFKLVYKEFGMKNYNGNNSPPSGILRYLDNYTPRDLVYWLRSELEPSDGQVYTNVKSRVESAGYSF